MSHFSLDKMVTEATKMDAPIQRGPLMRWQRKALEAGVRSLSLSEGSGLNVAGLVPKGAKSATCKTPGLTPTLLPSSKTPNKGCRTPNKGASGNKTPKTPNQNQGDRFIPNRSAMDMDTSHFLLMQNKNKNPTTEDEATDSPSKQEYKRTMLENLSGQVPENSKVLAFNDKAPPPKEGYMNNLKVLYSGSTSRQKKSATSRQIPLCPDRIMDAPDLIDDYYLNLISWSVNNHLAVALGGAVYLWNGGSGEITELLQTRNPDEYISCVSWIPEGNILAVGNSDGAVQLWDVEQQKLVRTMRSHSARVGALSWNSYILSSGSRDGSIHHNDVRIADHHVASLQAHSQEVCGLAWSPDCRYLASGGNDNLLCIWDTTLGMNVTPLYQLTQHLAAVKALAWCPWQPTLLASGGGTACRNICFWNANTGSCIQREDTGSQVCSILWSKEYRELISGHGFSRNQLTIWKYPSMEPVVHLTGHTSRVLSLAMSPDGTTVASAAADETLRMWKCFSVDKQRKSSQSKVSKDTSHVSNLNRLR